MYTHCAIAYVALQELFFFLFSFHNLAICMNIYEKKNVRMNPERERERAHKKDKTKKKAKKKLVVGVLAEENVHSLRNIRKKCGEKKGGKGTN